MRENPERRPRPDLTNEDMHEMSTFSAREAIERLERQAATDELTGLDNKRVFDSRMGSAFASSLVSLAGKEKRAGAVKPETMSVVLCDIDYFKNVNDTYGHPAGNKVLKEVARILKKHVPRETDCVARYGGEEFAIGLPGANESQAYEIMESIREEIEGLRIDADGKPVSTTMSFGITSVTNGAKDLHGALAQADKALYAAKRSGRNRAVLFSAIDPNISKEAQKGLPSWGEGRH